MVTKNGCEGLRSLERIENWSDRKCRLSFGVPMLAIAAGLFVGTVANVRSGERCTNEHTRYKEWKGSPAGRAYFQERKHTRARERARKDARRKERRRQKMRSCRDKGKRYDMSTDRCVGEHRGKPGYIGGKCIDGMRCNDGLTCSHISRRCVK